MLEDDNQLGGADMLIGMDIIAKGEPESEGETGNSGSPSHWSRIMDDRQDFDQNADYDFFVEQLPGSLMVTKDG